MFPNDPDPIELLDHLAEGGSLVDKPSLSKGFRVAFPNIIHLISVSITSSATRSGAQTEDWTPGLVEFMKDPIPILVCSRIFPKVVKRELQKHVCNRY